MCREVKELHYSLTCRSKDDTAMEEKIKQIMQQLFEVPEITEDASFTSVEKWDSLNHLNLIQILEQTFSVTFETDEMIEMLDYKTIVDTLKKRGTTF